MLQAYNGPRGHQYEPSFRFLTWFEFSHLHAVIDDIIFSEVTK